MRADGTAQTKEPVSLHMAKVTGETLATRPRPRTSFTAIVAGGMLLLCYLYIRLAIHAAEQPRDFVQDYVSARQLLAGQPLYPDLAPFRETFVRPPEGFGLFEYVHVNAHPPVSVLLALPVAGLPYGMATLVWEFTGLLSYAAMWWLILRGVGMPVAGRSRQLAAILAVLAFPPLTETLMSVTMSPYISLLLVAVWFWYRRGRRSWAALLLATAIALKLYPALLIGIFLVRRDWRTAAMASLAAVGIIALTLPILGVDAYREYLSVLPRISWWLATPWNLSVTGFFGRLFTDGRFTDPIIVAPALAAVLSAGVCGAVIALPAVVAVDLERRAPAEASGESFDLLYACAILALLLVCPLTWLHYAGPAALAWCILARRDCGGPDNPPACRRWLTTFAAITLIAPFVVSVWTRLINAGLFTETQGSAATSILLFSINTYVWLGMLVLSVRELGTVVRSPHSAIEKA